MFIEIDHSKKIANRTLHIHKQNLHCIESEVQDRALHVISTF